jgi:hypothetical protein
VKTIISFFSIKATVKKFAAYSEPITTSWMKLYNIALIANFAVFLIPIYPIIWPPQIPASEPWALLSLKARCIVNLDQTFIHIKMLSNLAVEAQSGGDFGIMSYGQDPVTEKNSLIRI